jgi:dephospho-CoA kinase
MMFNRMITIGITGTIGAGKGTIVEYLETKGFAHYSARKFLLKEVSGRGLEPVRSNIAMVANDLRKSHFPGYIIGELLNEAKSAGTDAVIESIRAIGELDLLKQNADRFYLLAIDAGVKLRYERILKRGSSTDHVSFEKFVEDEDKELDAKEAWNMNIKACIRRADFVLNNDGSFDKLEKEIDQILAQIKAKTA